MCGVVGVVAESNVNQAIYDGLSLVQHRGQDAAGIMTSDGQQFFLRKSNGLIRDVIRNEHMLHLRGNMGIGHVRYPTAGSDSEAEAQPLYVNSPYGIALAHNGNLINATTLKEELWQSDLRHLNTHSDTEILLNVFAHELQQSHNINLGKEDIFKAVAAVHRRCRGAYAVVAMITHYGVIGIRDPYGIRPLCLGERQSESGKKEYAMASESVALDAMGFTRIGDVAPGEAVIITRDGQLHRKQCSEKQQLSPCIFEYVYLARPDSMIDDILVYKFRLKLGDLLAQKIQREWKDHDIDVVMPVPDTSRIAAYSLSLGLNLKYREGLVKNHYIGRTFIMPGQQVRRKSVRRKLNAIGLEFQDKNVLLVDDSIVRGTTSKEIIQMARDAGAKKVYFASAAPEVRYPNVYGIDMPSANELIAHNRSVDEICQHLKADKLIFQDMQDLIIAAQEGNPHISRFEDSVFTGDYVTGDVGAAYLQYLEDLRSDSAKGNGDKPPQVCVDIHNNRDA